MEASDVNLSTTTAFLVMGLPVAVGIIAQAARGRFGFGWALISLLTELLAILSVYAILPDRMLRSHGEGPVVLVVLLSFIIILAVIGTLPHRTER